MSDLVSGVRCQGLGVRGELLRHCVYAGTHPNCDGWLILFEFQNFSVTVAFTEFTHGIEMDVREGNWLTPIAEYMDVEDVFEWLVKLMGPHPALPQMGEHNLGEENTEVCDG